MSGTLAIHPGALGDVLLAIPALRALRRDASRVVLGAPSAVGALLCELGEVDAHVRVEALGLDTLFADDAPPAPAAALRGFDRIVSWFGSRDARFVRRLAALAPVVHVAPSVSADRPVWEHLLASIGALPEGFRGPCSAPLALRTAARASLTGAGWDGTAPFVVVHPGASGPSKRWPVELFAELLTPLLAGGEVHAVVHEGPLDAEPSHALLGRLRSRCTDRVHHLDHPTLPILAGVLAQCTAYVGNDSGVSHLAAALGIPAVVLFKAAMRRWTPWSRTAECVATDTGIESVDPIGGIARALERALAAGRVASP